jgi:LPS sulfotransferase NodH
MLGFPLEYFTPKNFVIWRQRFGTKKIKDTFEMIKRYRTSPNGCFGCKLHFSHFKLLFEKYKIEDLFPAAKFIYIRRKNLLNQAVSLAKARMTESWISAQKPVKDAKYSAGAIEIALKDIVRDNARWEYLFTRRGWPFLGLYYEDFIANPWRAIQEVGQFLKVEIKSEIHLAPRQTPKKQSDDINKQFKDFYLSETKDPKFKDELNFLKDIDKLSTKSIGFQLFLSLKQNTLKSMRKLRLQLGKL